MKATELKQLIREEVQSALKENKDNYMFFQNLKTIKSAVDAMLQMDPYYNGDMDDMSIEAIIHHFQEEYNGFIIGDLIRAKMECEMNMHLQGISILNER